MPTPRTSVRRALADFPPPTPQPTPCRLWQGPTVGNNYGRRPDGELVHRWVWEQTHGRLPDGVQVLHRCDQPLCYRYEHLFLGTHGDNMADKAAKNRGHRPNAAGELNNAARLTDEDVLDIRASTMPHAAIAERFGITVGYVSAIRRHRAWRHLP